MALQRLRDLDRRFQRLAKRIQPLINELADAYTDGMNLTDEATKVDDDQEIEFAANAEVRQRLCGMWGHVGERTWLLAYSSFS